MKQTDIDTLKEMSRELLNDFPAKLVLDGNGVLYSGRLDNPISLQHLLEYMEGTRARLEHLNSAIQNIKGRESKK